MIFFHGLWLDGLTYLTDQFLVGCGVTIGAERLLQESQQHRHDDTGLQRLTKADEKYCRANSALFDLGMVL